MIYDDCRTFDPRVFPNLQLGVFSVFQEQVNAFFHFQKSACEKSNHKL